MKRFNTKKTLAAVALAAATFTAPALSHAAEYYPANSYNNDCRSNTEDQVVAGVLGAIVGGVLGSQVSGSGARTEGSAIGAVLGGAAGAAIADGANDCDKQRSRRSYNQGYRTVPTRTYDRGYQTGRTVYTRPRVRTVNHRGYRNNRGYNDRGYRNDRGYGYNDRGFNSLERINRRIRNLRVERNRLKDDQYYGYSRRTQRRLDDIAYELAELKQRKKRIRRSDRRSDRRADRHYHGSNVCYSTH